jgi:hypothetical protein
MPMPKLTFDEIVRQKDGSYLPRALVMARDAQLRAHDTALGLSPGLDDALARLADLPPGRLEVTLEAVRRAAASRRSIGGGW